MIVGKWTSDLRQSLVICCASHTSSNSKVWNVDFVLTIETEF